MPALDNMRGPRLETPVLFLLLLLSSLTGTATGDDGADSTQDAGGTDAEVVNFDNSPASEDDTVSQTTAGTDAEEDNGNTEAPLEDNSTDAPTTQGTDTEDFASEDEDTVSQTTAGTDAEEDNVNTEASEDDGTVSQTTNETDTEKDNGNKEGPDVAAIAPSNGESSADQAEASPILIAVIVSVVIIGAIVSAVFVMRRCKEKAQNQGPSYL
ncbi:lisH domain-containing protein C1711.05-like isoform X3 [Fundulus heteroclitus]|uniref:lisH domain-containing protein C1711.05-like isoform X3 n=1 Tax=Fundulus heteroclitus TaxID=8078 RepID=UPI00165A2072|nr:lisH domain-containing protein C1711.05-like isoform X3 [Fundulus heteroclitus]